jgi:RHS repeat-associated protein
MEQQSEYQSAYYAVGQRIAMRVGNSTGTNGLTYLLGDHPSPTFRTGSGSTSLTYEADTGATVTQLYKPWGEVRYQSGTLPTKYTFTGQYSHTADFGLLFYVARWYDPVLGRFAQADMVVPGMYNPMAFDRYSYVFNNPIRYSDPTGHVCYDAGVDAAFPGNCNGGSGTTPAPGEPGDCFGICNNEGDDESSGIGPIVTITPDMKIPPPPESGWEGDEYYGPPPDVPGLDPALWEWDHKRGGFVHPHDPGFVWRPHKKIGQKEGEAPHWDRRPEGAGGDPGIKFPPNPEYGRDGQPQAYPDYDEETGRYNWVNPLLVGVGTIVVIQYINSLPPMSIPISGGSAGGSLPFSLAD